MKISKGAKSGCQNHLYYRTVMVIEKEPLSGIADFAIPEDLAVYEEEIQQPSIFSLIDTNNEDEGEIDEY